MTSNGRVVVMATGDTVVSVTPLDKRRNIPGGTNVNPEKDEELEKWVQETRRHHQEITAQERSKPQLPLSSQPAPLASLETLASEAHAKCTRNSILACLPNNLDTSTDRDSEPVPGSITTIANNADWNQISQTDNASGERHYLDDHPGEASGSHCGVAPEQSEHRQQGNGEVNTVPPPEGNNAKHDRTDSARERGGHPGTSSDEDAAAGRVTESAHRSSGSPLPGALPPQLGPCLDPGPPPPPYSPPGNEDWRLICFDFPPRCINAGGILTTAMFESFDVLVDRANEWLRRHPSAGVKIVETMEHKTSHTIVHSTVNTEQATLSDVEAAGTLTIKSLRLWVEPKPFHARHLPVQQLGYINVVPACISPGGVQNRPEFDSQTVTLHKFNTLMKHRPMPGRVVNVETVLLKFRQYSKWVDPDRCHYRQHNDLSTSYLTMFRIYYEVGEPSWDELGYRDFKPDWHDPGGFDDFGHLVNEANAWSHSLSPDVNILNFQTLNIKAKFTRNKRVYVNTERSMSTLYNSSCLVQCLRLWYTCPPSTAQHQPPTASPSPALTHLTCRVFYPLKCKGGGMFEEVEFESMAETKIRMKQWLKANNSARVISAETTKLKLDPSIPFDHQINQSMFQNRSDGNASWTYLLRVYLDQPTQSPPEYEEETVVETVPIHPKPSTSCTVL